MSIGEMLLPEFDQEMSNTRKVLERVPVEKSEWKPHDKSMTMGRLAGHIAEIPKWGAWVLKSDSFDLASMGEGHQPYVPKSTADLLKTFDESAKEARKAIVGLEDPQWTRSWSLLLQGQTLASGQKLMMMRSTFLNHIVHHRAQMTVYLRLNNIPVPGLYGPSADER